MTSCFFCSQVAVIGNDGLRNIKGAFRRLMRATGMVRVEGNTPGLQELSESFSLLDYAGWDVRVRGNMNLVRVSKSFVSESGWGRSLDRRLPGAASARARDVQSGAVAGRVAGHRTDGASQPIFPVQSRERRRGRGAERKRKT